jgi:hypothetical protein
MHDHSRPPIELDAQATPRVVDLLCEAFCDYPLMQFVVGPEDEGYAERLRRLIHLFVARRVLCGDRLLGVGRRADLDAAAIVSRPVQFAETPEFRELHASTWSVLGEAARLRYDAYATACNGFDFLRPHMHVNMIGPRRRCRGTGLGRLMLDRIHRLSSGDPASLGVSLTTERLSNVAFYRHLGYRVVGEKEFAPGLQSWGLFRSDAI